jgi:hypothetical protein
MLVCFVIYVGIGVLWVLSVDKTPIVEKFGMILLGCPTLIILSILCLLVVIDDNVFNMRKKVKNDN